jgi:hypothetical protein
MGNAGSDVMTTRRSSLPLTTIVAAVALVFDEPDDEYTGIIAALLLSDEACCNEPGIAAVRHDCRHVIARACMRFGAAITSNVDEAVTDATAAAAAVDATKEPRGTNEAADVDIISK